MEHTTIIYYFILERVYFLIKVDTLTSRIFFLILLLFLFRFKELLAKFYLLTILPALVIILDELTVEPF